MSKPKNWPPSLPYLTRPLHDKDLTRAQLVLITSKPPSAVPMPASSTPRHVRIQPITDPNHPAHGQHGLFATRVLKAHAFILPYLGCVHGGPSPGNYDMWLDKEGDVAVDAAAGGNEARFVNDYRGVRARPNAVLGEGWCDGWGERCMGVWVGNEPVRKGSEIVVSYGKGFWEARA